MGNKKLKKYLSFKGISKAEAAKQIGCSRQYLFALANGQPAGKRVAMQIEKWSEGFITAIEMMGLGKSGQG